MNQPNEHELLRICGSREWVRRMSALQPFKDEATFYAAAEKTWRSLSREDWLEAFSHHPQIGEKGLREKWTSQEQSGTQGASYQTLRALADGNTRYRERFGYVFLICATGKSADEMLKSLRSRSENSPEAELGVAAEEQSKIMRIRIEKWLKNPL